MYRPGGCTELGCIDAPGTYGVADLGGRVRIVWHYSAADEVRTFQIRYTLRGLAVAYDDVVDVNLRVWGDEWKERLGTADRVLVAPGKIAAPGDTPSTCAATCSSPAARDPARAGRPGRAVRGAARAGPARPPSPRPTGMHVVRGNGLGKILCGGVRGRGRLRARSRPDRARQAPPVAVCRVRPAAGARSRLLVVAAVFAVYGREHSSGYDREYEQEPPTDTEPALLPTLLRQGGEAGSFEFTATLFDLIRRGVFASTPVTTERSTWGGLRKESVADLELSRGKRDEELTPWENAVTRVVDGVVGRRLGAPFAVPRADRGRRAAMSKHFTAFKANVSTASRKPEMVRLDAASLPLVVALVVFAAIAVLMFLLAINGWRSVYPRWSDVVLIGVGIAACMNAAIVLVALTQRSCGAGTRARPRSRRSAGRHSGAT